MNEKLIGTNLILMQSNEEFIVIKGLIKLHFHELFFNDSRCRVLVPASAEGPSDELRLQWMFHTDMLKHKQERLLRQNRQDPLAGL